MIDKMATMYEKMYPGFLFDYRAGEWRIEHIKTGNIQYATRHISIVEVIQDLNCLDFT